MFTLFIFCEGERYLGCYERYMDPHEMETVYSLSSLAQQTHVKVVFCDYVDGSIVDWQEFENVFDFQEVAVALAKVIGHEPEGDFLDAKDQFMRENPIEELLEM